MAKQQQKYFIGPSLLSDIRATITRVDAIAPRTSGAAQPVRLQELQRPTGKTFRICTFTGSWSIDTQKTVTFRGITSTPNTVTVENLFATISGSTSTSTATPCAIAKDGTAWYLIAARCDSA